MSLVHRVDVVLYLSLQKKSKVTFQIAKLRSTVSGHNVSIFYTCGDNGNMLSVNSGGRIRSNAMTPPTNRPVRTNKQRAISVSGPMMTKVISPSARNMPIPPKRSVLYRTRSTIPMTVPGAICLIGYNCKPITSDTIGKMLTGRAWTYTWECGRELRIVANGDNH